MRSRAVHARTNVSAVKSSARATVPGQEQREAEDIRVVAFVQIAEAVHAVYSDTRRVRKGYLALLGRVIAWTRVTCDVHGGRTQSGAAGGSSRVEVPVGAVLVVGNKIIARAFDQPISANDPTAHAEVLVLREAARALGNYRLTDATVSLTVEPCLMCVGAMVPSPRARSRLRLRRARRRRARVNPEGALIARPEPSLPRHLRGARGRVSLDHSGVLPREAAARGGGNGAGLMERSRRSK